MSEVVQALIEALGPGVVKVNGDIPARNHLDQGGLAPIQPMALLLPRRTEDVAVAMQVCHRFGQAVVVQGGLTGLAGGGHPRRDEVALSLERMNGIEEVDTASNTITALAGTPLQAIQAAAEEVGLLCGIDLGARGTCTIGGNVATNAGGNQVLRYGMTRRNVLGLEVVLADGRVVTSLNKMLKNNAGYDWTQLFIGSEGTLGIVTRVVVGLHARPEGVQTALCAVGSVSDALAVLRNLERNFAGGLLVFEGMWQDFMDIATKTVRLPRPFSADHEILLLIEVAEGAVASDGTRLESVLGDLIGDGVLEDAVIAKSGQDRTKLWALRESVYEYGRFYPKVVGFDVSVPHAVMGEAIAACRAAISDRWPEGFAVCFGHLADSNVHVIVVVPDLDAAMKMAVEETVYGVVSDFGGSVSAEHGIGRNKRPYLKLSRSAAELELMGMMKQSMDPRGILNPGRVLTFPAEAARDRLA